MYEERLKKISNKKKSMIFWLSLIFNVCFLFGTTSTLNISAMDSCYTREGYPNNVECGWGDVVVKNSSSSYNRITYLKFALSSLQGLKRKKELRIILQPINNK